MDKHLESLIKNYDPEKDIEETGGENGIYLANKILELKKEEERDSKIDFREEGKNEKKLSRFYYQNFLEKAERISSGNYREIRELLIRYFPNRFSDKGKQPLFRMDDHSVFGLFQALKRYAAEIQKE